MLVIAGLLVAAAAFAACVPPPDERGGWRTRTPEAAPAGIAGDNPGSVRGKPVRLAEPGPDGWQAMAGERAAAVSLWTKPGGGHSGATASAQLVSMMLRHVTGMEPEQWIAKKPAAPMGWGRWGFGYQRPEIRHTPGGGGIAMRAADMLRFAWLLVNGGRWGGAQLVPAGSVRHCGRMSPRNPPSAYSLQFDVNGDGHAAGVPRGAFWKTGSGGHAFSAAPSMKLAVFKPGGRDSRCTEKTTVPLPRPGAIPAGGDSRPGWKRLPGEGDGEAAVQTLRMVSGALR